MGQFTIDDRWIPLEIFLRVLPHSLTNKQSEKLLIIPPLITGSPTDLCVIITVLLDKKRFSVFVFDSEVSRLATAHKNQR